jgi:hypothetical protein
VGSGDFFFKIALLHPFPSSRRHVIRVDMHVLVDVIRVAFWMERVMNMLYYNALRIAGGMGQGKCKITMLAIEISA